MREYNHKTIIITKEAWKFLWNYERQRDGYKPCTEELLDRIWNRMCFRNGGANPETHPITENEIRIDKDTFSTRFESTKDILKKNGYGYRQDGFVVTGFYL